MVGNKTIKKYDYRLYFHVIIAVISWLLFFYLWYLTFATKLFGLGPIRDLLTIALTGVAVSIIDIWWIMHNVNIYKKKGPRRAVNETEKIFDEDFFGRKIKSDWACVQQCDYLHITSSKDFKWYFEDNSRGMRFYGKVS